MSCTSVDEKANNDYFFFSESQNEVGSPNSSIGKSFSEVFQISIVILIDARCLIEKIPFPDQLSIL